MGEAPENSDLPTTASNQHGDAAKLDIFAELERSGVPAQKSKEAQSKETDSKAPSASRSKSASKAESSRRLRRNLTRRLRRNLSPPKPNLHLKPVPHLKLSQRLRPKRRRPNPRPRPQNRSPRLLLLPRCFSSRQTTARRAVPGALRLQLGHRLQPTLKSSRKVRPKSLSLRSAGDSGARTPHRRAHLDRRKVNLTRTTESVPRKNRAAPPTKRPTKLPTRPRRNPPAHPAILTRKKRILPLAKRLKMTPGAKVTTGAGGAAAVEAGAGGADAGVGTTTRTLTLAMTAPATNSPKTVDQLATPKQSPAATARTRAKMGAVARLNRTAMNRSGQAAVKSGAK